jgi:hypothetical protein
MPLYTLRFKTHGGRTFSEDQVHCAGDQAAIALALGRKIDVGKGIEVWQEARLVAVLDNSIKPDGRR